MVIKLYISGISGNKEVKKKQQRVQMILDSKQIDYEAIDITEPGKEKDKEFMQQNGKVRESLGKYPLPPQIFNDDDFCGDYEDFDMANEVDELEKFLHIETNSKEIENGSKQDEISEVTGGFYGKNKNSNDSVYNPYDYHTFRVKYDNVNGLKEEIISTGNLIDDEKEQNEENAKSEVNGESETVPALDPSKESIAESVEISADDSVAPEKEESAIKEGTAEDESKENLGDNQEEIKVETQEKEEESEDVENTKEEEVESQEKSPLTEQKEDEKEEIIDDGESKGKIAGEEEEEEKDEKEVGEEEQEEEEEKESGQESPESEKLEEE